MTRIKLMGNNCLRRRWLLRHFLLFLENNYSFKGNYFWLSFLSFCPFFAFCILTGIELVGNICLDEGGCCAIFLIFGKKYVLKGNLFLVVVIKIWHFFAFAS